MLFLYLLSIQPVSDLLLKPLENSYPPLSSEFKKDWPQAVVILGGGIIQGSPEAGAGNDTLTSDAIKRVLYAYSVRDTYKVPYIFSGGKTFEYGQDTEALTAGRLFVSLGFPFERLILESRSRNTWENARETSLFGFRKVIL
ncbi:YdcF family protein, partial [Treponema sp. R6D11]